MKFTRSLHPFVLGLFLASPAWAQVTRRLSVAPGGVEASSHNEQPSISADGRYVVFESAAYNLVAGDTNGTWDIFVRAVASDLVEVISVDSNESLGNGYCDFPSISADGRYVAYGSLASNLVSGDSEGQPDVFVRDRVDGTTQRVSVSSIGAAGNFGSFNPKISGDGRCVAFQSWATNLVVGDTNGCRDVFLRDRLSGVTERLSVSSAGVQGNGDCSYVSISADGRYVAFTSTATNLVSGDTNGSTDVFVRDRVNGVTVRASVNNGGTQGNGHSAGASVSADGRYVAFWSEATNLIGPLAFDTNGFADVFCRDLVDANTSRVSLSSSSEQGNGDSTNPSISADGLYVAFTSQASNLVSFDTNGDEDVFVRLRSSTGATERVSVSSGGAQGNDFSFASSISGDARFVAFTSLATNLVASDTNGVSDVFLHDRRPSGFTSVCDPGAGGVIGCPCANPPSASGRGCDNSANTGGAYLAASGMAYLSTDSLIFTSFAEKPGALSILLQGNAPIAVGAVYGQGVRCAGGTLKRLFVKNASGGSITAPDFLAGDPTISARSAAKGDTIQAGQSRWYLVYYRDPTALGGCPSTSTFNATQTGRVTWMP